MKSNAWYLVYYKTFEILFGSLVIAFYYLYRGQEIPILPYLVLTLATTYLFIFLIHTYQEKSRFLFFMIVFPLVVVGGLLLNFPILFILLLALLIYWRTSVMNSEDGSVQTGVWLFLTVFLGFILLIIANIQGYPQNPLVIIIVLNLAFIVMGGFLINWLSVVENKQVKRRLLGNFLSIMGILMVLSLLLVALRDVLKWVVVSILKLGVFAASFVFSPIFHWVENYELTGELNPFEQIQNAESQVDTESTNLIHDQSSVVSKMDIHFTYWYFAVLIILCILLFIYLYKKFQGTTEVLDTTENQYYTISFDDGGKGTSSSKNKRSGEQPSHRVRKEMYRLEKMAEKLQLGRSSSEAIGEWFTRVGVNEDEVIQSVYERVRYGNQMESDEEYKIFLQKIESKKSELKQIHKLLLEEGKIQSKSRVKNIMKAFKPRAEEH
ncbi:hypothetical protein ACN6MT_18760 [Neobacillus niacini]|uniref:hypothetical protein n=1 Tax=Neobacillus niacini TaxID=86668 RepID=UPI003B015E85